jgi:ethanolamine phosphate transferase 2 subunit G
MIGLPKTSCILSNILLGCSIVLFAAGFFPRKAFLPGLATWPTDRNGSAHAAPFDKVIFMVVDALRSDFVYSSESQFLFTQSLIRSGAAVPFDGHASPPTITMPRIKAITTGSVPSFLDVVLNFAESDTTSTLGHQDSWLAQSKAKPGTKLVMYGDDTWLKLFPGFFDRSDGTTSFFVSDFTEVDQNVTRHVPVELARTDWSVMVLHYLGLDHIGHKSGPRSINMAPKQREMDTIVEDIYHAMEKSAHLKSSLLILCGDHGMNEAGNHGGSSSGEVNAALTFISPKFQAVYEGFDSPRASTFEYSFYDKVEQSDIAPTLASLLGFPIPLNSLGIVIPTLLELWPQASDKLDLLVANAQQIAEVAHATYPEAFKKFSSSQACASANSDAEFLSCAWFETQNAFQAVKQSELSTPQAMSLTLRFLKSAQDLLSGTASNYDLSKMAAGIGFVAVSLILASMSIPDGTFDTLVSGSAFSLIVLCHSVTMFASSYVEEEHQFWYWVLGGWLMYISFKEQRLISFYSLPPIRGLLMSTVAFLFGIVRHVNSTGQKYAALPSISSAVFPAETWLLWTSTIATYALISRCLTRRASTWAEAGSRQLSLLPVPVCIAAFMFKVAFTHADSPELLKDFQLLSPLIAMTSRYSLVGQARIVFLGIAHMLACALYYEAPWKKQETGKYPGDSFIHTFHNLLSLFLLTQTRVNNIPVFLLFSIQLSLLSAEPHLFNNLAEISLTSLLFQQSAFFALGGTNAISSVDLSNAYNGVSGYNVLLVGILTFISNWAGPIWWVSGTALLLREKKLADGNSRNVKNSSTSALSVAEREPKGGEVDSMQGSSGQTLQSASFTHFALLTLFTSASTLSVMLACTLLREHLFIWTVFSPKYLYMGAWALGHHFIINGLFGWGLLGKLTER